MAKWPYNITKSFVIKTINLLRHDYANVNKINIFFNLKDKYSQLFAYLKVILKKFGQISVEW